MCGKDCQRGGGWVGGGGGRVGVTSRENERMILSLTKENEFIACYCCFITVIVIMIVIQTKD